MIAGDLAVFEDNVSLALGGEREREEVSEMRFPEGVGAVGDIGQHQREDCYHHNLPSLAGYRPPHRPLWDRNPPPTCCGDLEKRS